MLRSCREGDMWVSWQLYSTMLSSGGEDGRLLVNVYWRDVRWALRMSSAFRGISSPCPDGYGFDGADREMLFCGVTVWCLSRAGLRYSTVHLTSLAGCPPGLMEEFWFIAGLLPRTLRLSGEQYTLRSGRSSGQSAGAERECHNGCK